MDSFLISLGSEKILEPLQPGKRARMRDCSIVLAHWHRLGDGSVMREVSAAAGPAQRRGSQDALSYPPEEWPARQCSNQGQLPLGPVVATISGHNFCA